MNQIANTPLDLGDYWSMFWRRKWWFAIPFGSVACISIALAMLLPASYHSEATIVVERQNVPTHLVSTTVTGYVQEQIEQIRQEIVTYDNLLEMAEAHNLYSRLRVKDPGSVVAEMASSIEVEMNDVYVADPDEKGQGIATISFTVGFNAPSAQAARDVANELSERYLALHKAAREEQAAEVSKFLQREADALRSEIGIVESDLASFKQDELRQLPELMDMNLQLYEKTDQDIDRSREAIRGHRDRIDAFRAELSLTDPYKAVQTEDGGTLLTASERLSTLTAQYLRASARYSAEHPDIIRLRREISLLAEETGTGGRADEIMSELVNLQDQLRDARNRYSDSHPEVHKLEKSVGALQRGLQTALIAGQSPKTQTLPPDNPRYVTLQTQLDAAQTNLRAEQQNLVKLQAKLEEYEERLFNTPVVERNYKSLSRDYENALSKYRELKEKQLQARLAINLESGENAERWELISDAFLPALPDSPNRLGIALLGMMLATAAGLGGVGAAEYTDTTVRGSRAVLRATGAPPLAIVPDFAHT